MSVLASSGIEHDSLLPLIDEDQSHSCSSPNLQSKEKRYFRYFIVFLLSFGFIMDFLLRINMSVALDGGMVPSNCSNSQTRRVPRCWSQEQQGYVLSSFYWGYWVTQIPSAILCYRLGASNVFVGGLLLAILSTLITPLASGYSLWSVLVLRVLVGLGQGSTFPVALNIITSWAAAREIGIVTAFASGGQFLGAILANSVSGLLVTSHFLGGWPSLFYVYAGIGILWSILWFCFVRDSPQSSACMHESEKRYLSANSLPKKPVRISDIPWKGIISSGPVWSTVIFHGCNCYSFFLLLSDLPKFLVEVLNFNIQDSGFLGSMPYLMTWFGFLLSGRISDFVISRGYLSKLHTRKVVGLCAMFIPGVLLFFSTFFTDKVPILVFMNMAMFFQGFANSALYVNYTDLSPRFAAILCGFGNTLCALMGIVGPVLVGLLVNGVPLENTTVLKHKWQLAFASASLVWAAGSIQYCVFASASIQPFDGGGEVKRKRIRSSQID